MTRAKSVTSGRNQTTDSGFFTAAQQFDTDLHLLHKVDILGLKQPIINRFSQTHGPSFIHKPESIHKVTVEFSVVKKDATDNNPSMALNRTIGPLQPRVQARI
jgi:hypothetical protein